MDDVRHIKGLQTHPEEYERRVVGFFDDALLDDAAARGRVSDMAAAFASYRRVLTVPGAWVFSVGGLLARMPMAMVSLGIVLLVSSRTGSYGTGGHGVRGVPRRERLVRDPPGEAHRPARAEPGAAGGGGTLHPRAGRDDGLRRGGAAGAVAAPVRRRGRCRAAPDRLLRAVPLVAPGRGQGRPPHRLRLRVGGRRGGLHRRPGPGDDAGHHRAPARRARLRGGRHPRRHRAPGQPEAHRAARLPGRPRARTRPDAVAGAGAR